MNKVITINLGGIAFQLEEGGYDALRAYFDKAKIGLNGNPDKDEILADIERALGEKFRALLGQHKNVVTTTEVAAVLRELGPVEGGAGETGAAAAGEGAGAGKHDAGTFGAGPTGEAKKVRRLYRLNEGAMFAGVCSGLQAFTGVPALAWRFAFLGFSFATFGLTALVYVAMIFVVPLADTPDEKADAQGPIPTAQDFIRRAKAGYYESMKGFPDKQARRAWKREFRENMREWKQNFRWEMKRNSNQWQNNWNGFCARQSWLSASPGWVWAVGGLVQFLIFGVFLLAAITMVHSGHFFGAALPQGVPIWVGLLMLIVLFQIVSLPFRLLFWGGCGKSHHNGGFVFLVLAVLAFSWWIYPTETRDFIHQIPPTLRQGADAVRDWWAGR